MNIWSLYKNLHPKQRYISVNICNHILTYPQHTYLNVYIINNVPNLYLHIYSTAFSDRSMTLRGLTLNISLTFFLRIICNA